MPTLPSPPPEYRCYGIVPTLPTPPVRLYCFPHAGATSLAYRGWQDLAGPGLHIVGVDVPGRGTRSREPKAGGYHALVASLTDHVLADLREAEEANPGVRYATFGHSFGATMSFSVAAAVTRATGHAPVRSVVSAAAPPRLQLPGDLAALSDEDLLARTAADGGTPRQVLASPAMSRMLLRNLREDLTVRQEFPAQAASLRVDFPLTAIAAEDDPHAAPETMAHWSEHSSAPTHHLTIPGGHFAAVQDPGATLALITEDLRAHVSLA